MTTDILIFSAVQEETESLRHCIDDEKRLTIGRRDLIAGRINGNEVRLLITGPGAANTIQAVTACIEKKRPGLLIQTGIAGAFRNSNLTIGEIGIATEEIDVHLGIEAESETMAVSPLPFPVLRKKNLEIKNRYPFHSGLATFAFTILKQHFSSIAVTIKADLFVTVATITATDKRAEQLAAQYGACMESMEGAAAAHISLHYDIPLLEIRSVSNMVGKRNPSEWNVPLACSRCCEAVLVFLKNYINSINTQIT